jgi:uncharacterized protein (TIGR03663 family)
MNRGYYWCFLLVFLLAAGLRCAELGDRPMHTDESVDADKAGRLWRDGYYRYNPAEYHGPTLAYATLAWQKLTLAPDFALWTESRLRSLTVLFGLGLILLLPLVSDGLGRNATIGAALLTAVSPFMVYYSRDYIHETLMVFFTFLALAAGWRYARERKLRWLLLAGAGIGLMQATKETFIFNLAAAASAGLLTWRFRPAQAAGPFAKPAKPMDAWHFIAAAGAWVVVAILFFSSFFSNPSGPLDAARTYEYWMQSAKGASPHVHEWSFYAQRLLYFHVKGGPVWSEGLILALAVGGSLVAFGRRPLAGANTAFIRFLAFYTGVLTLIYTVLPYKTPWCALGFWHGAILLAGVGAAALLDGLKTPRLKLAAGIILLTGVGQLAFQAWQAAVPYAADQHNPWCYAQTSRDLLNLVGKVEELADVAPEGRGMRINIMVTEDDYWPLPWYLRRYSGTEWRSEIPNDPKVPVDPYAPVIIVSRDLESGLDTNKTGIGPLYSELRAGTLLELYVQTNLWSAHLQHSTK